MGSPDLRFIAAAGFNAFVITVLYITQGLPAVTSARFKSKQIRIRAVIAEPL
jgi:hypothetical protein